MNVCPPDQVSRTGRTGGATCCSSCGRCRSGCAPRSRHYGTSTEAARTPEGRLAKALDKLETIMQHNQGRNPGDFDYRYNLHYGARYTADDPLVVAMREVLDAETEARAREAERG